MLLILLFLAFAEIARADGVPQFQAWQCYTDALRLSPTKINKGITRTGQPVSYESLDRPLREHLSPPPKRIFLIGSGIGGGDVYRVIPENGAPYLIKRYAESASLSSDVVGLNYLSQFQSKLSAIGVQISIPTKLDNRTLLFADIQAQSVQDYCHMLNGNGKRTLSRQIETRANQKMQQIYEIISQSSTVERKDAVLILKTANGDRLKFYLHSGNLLIDAESGKIVISDPF